jgi:hypothetical protein
MDDNGHNGHLPDEYPSDGGGRSGGDGGSSGGNSSGGTTTPYKPGPTYSRRRRSRFRSSTDRRGAADKSFTRRFRRRVEQARHVVICWGPINSLSNITVDGKAIAIYGATTNTYTRHDLADGRRAHVGRRGHVDLRPSGHRVHRCEVPEADSEPAGAERSES